MDFDFKSKLIKQSKDAKLTKKEIDQEIENTSPCYYLDSKTKEYLSKPEEIPDKVKVNHFLLNYNGRSSFLHKMKYLVKKHGINYLSEAQIATSIKVINEEREYKRSLKSFSKRSELKSKK